MKIERIMGNKKQYLDLLLLADEQEDMIDKYLETGEMFALSDEDIKTICVVTKVDDETSELKNIATYEKYQGKGYGKKIIHFVTEYYKGKYKTILVGTAEVPSMMKFYNSCGFEKSHYVKNFFVDNYVHSMFAEGMQLIDMVYLKRKL